MGEETGGLQAMGPKESDTTERLTLPLTSHFKALFQIYNKQNSGKKSHDLLP